MNQEEIIGTMNYWKNIFLSDTDERKEIIESAFQHNKWFTPENILLMLENISSYFLDKKLLTDFVKKYENNGWNENGKTVGLIMAGNIPLVGFHDLLCVLLSGNNALIKLSSKDKILLPWLAKKLLEINPAFESKIIFAEVLKDMDAVIATGGENAGRYFDFYFGKYPHLFRGNRGSVAVLNGDEKNRDLKELGEDIFSYFGLGCRNVSKLLLPRNFNFDKFFKGISSFKKVEEHTKYKNNFDYNLTLFLLNKTPHIHNEFLILAENKEIVSPVSVLHYEFYENENHLREIILRDKEKLQCVVGKNFQAFGKTQSPQLADFADGIDTFSWLNKMIAQKN